MEIIILGSGTGLPSWERGSPSILLRMKENVLAMDMGPGTLRQMARAGIPFYRINLVLITHFHPDHINDLAHFLFALRSPAILGEKGPVTLAGPVGINNFVQLLKAMYGKWVDFLHKESKILEILPGHSFEFNGIGIKSCRTFHTEESLAYSIEIPGKGPLVYSGDAAFSQELLMLSKGVETLILECSLPDGTGEEAHLTPQKVGILAKEAGVKTLILTHFYPEVLQTDIALAVRHTFQGELILARDLLRIPLR